MSEDTISREALRKRMYHEAFEVDNDMNKWDSGLWIRYKLFEKVIEETPAVDCVEVVRCKDCVSWMLDTEPIGIECEPGEEAHNCAFNYCWITRSSEFCCWGDRR